MKKAYFVKDVFYTLQGEGLNAGRPAVFLRFAGCNLWSGREEDRGKGPGGCSLWCDTDFRGGTRYDLESLANEVSKAWGPGHERRFVVLTGGEPSLQVDRALIDEIHLRNFEIAIETNGTHALPHGIDWVTVSPKAGGQVVLDRANEIKLAFPQTFQPPIAFDSFPAEHRWLQPIAGPDLEKNTRAALAYCLAHPAWRLSRQMHKEWSIP